MNLLLNRKSACVRRMHYLMGCFIEIEAVAGSKEIGIEVVESAFTKMKEIEKQLSRFVETSLTSHINRCASTFPVELPQDMFDLIKTCLRYSKLTEGSFDITVNPFTELWSFSEKEGKVPTANELAKVSSRVGYQHIVLNEAARTIYFQQPNMQIDFGAVGKGYAIDQAIQILKSYKIKKVIVNAGSTIFSLDEEVSCFGILDSTNDQRIVRKASLRNNAISTSAQTERFWTVNGINYGHVLNPKTGRPMKGSFSSVSVIASSAMLSDALSTAVFIGGNSLAQSLLHRLPKIQILTH